MRPELSHPPVTPTAATRMTELHREVVDKVRAAVDRHPVVVVGMGWNVPVKRVRAALDEAAIPYEYVEIGNYAGKWRERLAVKLWSGWPTFPQVFVRGTLIGGNDESRAALADGSFQERVRGA
ncbi:MAG: glutaredoxin [Myxococcota bacterium]